MESALVIVANPTAGSGKAPELVERLRTLHSDARVVLSEGPEGVREVVADLDLDTAHTLAVLGGDGTVHQAVSGLFDAHLSSMPTLAPVPCGSGNALAAALGIRGTDDAIKAIAGEAKREIDVARLESDEGVCHAINVIGWGLSARVTLRAAAARGAGKMPYTKAALCELLWGDASPVEAALDGSPSTRDSLGMACLTPHAGGGMPVAPDALLDDGALDLVRVSPTGRLRLLALFTRLLFGKHLSARGVSHQLHKELQIEFESVQPVVVDGEMIESKRLSIEVFARALRVCSPR